jgi:hypothetical protein
LSTWLTRALAALVLLANMLVVAFVVQALVREAPTWLALHYAPTSAVEQCDLTVARLTRGLRRARGGALSAEDGAMLAALRAGSGCEDGTPAVRAIEARIGAGAD